MIMLRIYWTKYITINNDNKEQRIEDSDDEIKDNNIEKNINEDMENFIKNFNQLNIEKRMKIIPLLLMITIKKII